VPNVISGITFVRLNTSAEADVPKKKASDISRKNPITFDAIDNITIIIKVRFKDCYPLKS
jgi:hypothetical protein